MNKMALYNHLPVFAQNIACNLEGKRIAKSRYGPSFWRCLDDYEARSSWSYDQLIAYRNENLSKMLHHCYESVPYYRMIFDEGGINPDSIVDLDGLKSLPILTKDTVKRYHDDFISVAVDPKLMKNHQTGGTTGAGLDFITTDSEEAEQWAVWWRFRRRHGITFETRCAVFTGKMIVPTEAGKPPYWRYNIPGNQIYYSGYHIRRETAEAYAESLLRERIQWIHGYPSVIANLAVFLNEAGISIPVKWVTTGAENLYPHQCREIEAAFHRKPIQHYGLTEGVANISQLPDGNLCVDEDFSCVEFICNGSEQKIIGTSLTNFAMPLIRYDTGDCALINEHQQRCESGRIVKGLLGRSNEAVVLPNGSIVGAAALSLVMNKFPAVKESQFVQDSRNEVKCNVILGDSMESEFNEGALVAALRERLGDCISISIGYPEALEKTRSGKHRLVVSSLEQPIRGRV